MHLFKLCVCFMVSTIANVHGSQCAIPKKILNDGHKIPGFGIGTWLGFNKEMTDSVRPVGNEVQRAVEWAIDAGYRLFDTALVYYTETQVGRAIKNKIAEGIIKREDVFVVTKLWNTFHKKDDVVKGLTQSLKNLDMDYVDLYLMHFPIALNANGSISSIDYLQAWQGMIGVQKKGLVRSIGVSNFNKQQLERLISKSNVKPAVLENEVNLNQQPSEMISFCHRHNITLIAYSPTGSLFCQKVKPGAPPPRVNDPTLVKMALEHNKTVPQVVFRYLMNLGVIPIPMSLNKCHIEENINVCDIYLTKKDKYVLKSFNKYYRTLNISMWEDSPYYPYHEKIL